MELVLARQSVIIKCNIQSSVMMGNYEFYYAGGLLCRLAGTIPEQTFRPEDFYAFLQPVMDSYEPQKEQEAYLVKMLKEYKAADEYDGQMAELMQMGLKEDNMWKQFSS